MDLAEPRLIKCTGLIETRDIDGVVAVDILESDAQRAAIVGRQLDAASGQLGEHGDGIGQHAGPEAQRDRTPDAAAGGDLVGALGALDGDHGLGERYLRNRSLLLAGLATALLSLPVPDVALRQAHQLRSCQRCRPECGEAVDVNRVRFHGRHREPGMRERGLRIAPGGERSARAFPGELGRKQLITHRAFRFVRAQHNHLAGDAIVQALRQLRDLRVVKLPEARPRQQADHSFPRHGVHDHRDIVVDRGHHQPAGSIADQHRQLAPDIDRLRALERARALLNERTQRERRGEELAAWIARQQLPLLLRNAEVQNVVDGHADLADDGDAIGSNATDQRNQTALFVPVAERHRGEAGGPRHDAAEVFHDRLPGPVVANRFAGPLLRTLLTRTGLAIIGLLEAVDIIEATLCDDALGDGLDIRPDLVLELARDPLHDGRVPAHLRRLLGRVQFEHELGDLGEVGRTAARFQLDLPLRGQGEEALLAALVLCCDLRIRLREAVGIVDPTLAFSQRLELRLVVRCLCLLFRREIVVPGVDLIAPLGELLIVPLLVLRGGVLRARVEPDVVDRGRGVSRVLSSGDVGRASVLDGGIKLGAGDGGLCDIIRINGIGRQIVVTRVGRASSCARRNADGDLGVVVRHRCSSPE